MKILILECTAKELSANKTVMDSLIGALNRFTNSFCGIDFNPDMLGGLNADCEDTEADGKE